MRSGTTPRSVLLTLATLALGLPAPLHAARFSLDEPSFETQRESVETYEIEVAESDDPSSDAVPVIAVAAWQEGGSSATRPTRRAVIRLVVPDEEANTATAPASGAPASGATTETTTEKTPAAETPVAPSTVPASAPSSDSAVPQPTRAAAARSIAAESSSTRDSEATNLDIDSANALAIPATDRTTTSEAIERTDPFLLEILPITTASASAPPSFRVALTHRGEEVSGTARATLKLSTPDAIVRIRPESGWKFDRASGLWSLEVNGWEAGLGKVWTVDLREGLDRCIVEARVVSWGSGIHELAMPELPAAPESTLDPAERLADDSTTPGQLPLDNDADTDTEADTDVDAESNDLDEPRRLTEDDAPSTDEAFASESDDALEITENDDEPLAAESDVSAIDFACEGPTTTRSGTSLILRLTIRNRSSEPVSGLELATEFPQGVFLEGRRNVQLGDAIPAGKTRSIEIAVRAHDAGRHELGFVLLQGDESVARATHDLQVLDGALDVRLEGPERFPVGQDATFTVRLEHQGTEPLEDLIVTLALAEGLRVTKVEHEAGYDADSNRLAWRIVRLAPGDRLELRYMVRAERGGEVRQSVEVTGDDLATGLGAELAARVIGEDRSRIASEPRRPEAPRASRTPDRNGRVPLSDPPSMRR